MKGIIKSTSFQLYLPSHQLNMPDEESADREHLLDQNQEIGKVFLRIYDKCLSCVFQLKGKEKNILNMSRLPKVLFFT